MITRYSKMRKADNPPKTTAPEGKDKPLQEQLNRHMIEPLKLMGTFQQRFVKFLKGLYSSNISNDLAQKVHKFAQDINDQLNSSITAMKEFKSQKISKMVLEHLYRKRTASNKTAAVSPEHIQEVRSWRDALVAIWTKTLSAQQYIPPERYDRLKASLTRLFELADGLALLLQSNKG